METPCIAKDATTGATKAAPVASLERVSRLDESSPSSASFVFASLFVMPAAPTRVRLVSREPYVSSSGDLPFKSANRRRSNPHAPAEPQRLASRRKPQPVRRTLRQSPASTAFRAWTCPDPQALRPPSLCDLPCLMPRLPVRVSPRRGLSEGTRPTVNPSMRIGPTLHGIDVVPVSREPQAFGTRGGQGPNACSIQRKAPACSPISRR
jgi:hypothetical protein